MRWDDVHRLVRNVLTGTRRGRGVDLGAGSDPEGPGPPDELTSSSMYMEASWTAPVPVTVAAPLRRREPSADWQLDRL